MDVTPQVVLVYTNGDIFWEKSCTTVQRSSAISDICTLVAGPVLNSRRYGYKTAKGYKSVYVQDALVKPGERGIITSSPDADNGKWIRVVGIWTGDIESKHISPLYVILWFVDAVRDLDYPSVEYLMHEKEFGYALNRRYSTWANDIWALGVVLVTMMVDHAIDEFKPAAFLPFHNHLSLLLWVNTSVFNGQIPISINVMRCWDSPLLHPSQRRESNWGLVPSLGVATKWFAAVVRTFSSTGSAKSTEQGFIIIANELIAILAVSCCFLGLAAPTIYITQFISEPQFSGRCWCSSQFSLLCQDLMMFFDSVYADHEHTREGVVRLGLTGVLAHLVLRKCHATLNSESPPNWPSIFCTTLSRRSSMSSSAIPV
ncbi:hypothetical protein EV421DRAFT_1735426 [Armillaria borealis]|uniref:Uncharacterized protein n=1 Tax=Armillaria borealis TaxID=47425 RepID=A0AA39JJZ7_9AGAR|nr:hypothetical protein EV421DRAFT_1735426 [Armillaria borealis]